MRRTIIILLSCFSTSVVLLHACKKKDPFVPAPTPVSFVVPEGFPQPAHNFTSSPLTKEGVALGRKLFYDGILSKDGTISCASCHEQRAAFTTFEHDLGHGYNHSHTTRNPLVLFNLAWQKEFMHDGGKASIDQVITTHINSQIDMGETVENVVNKLNGSSTYQQMFRAAYGDKQVTQQKLTDALKQFMLSMVSADSKYDRVKKGTESFTLAEGLGYDIFKQKCASCHQEPLFTDLSYRNIGIVMDVSTKDVGRMKITANAADSLKFKVPTLRNVMYSGQYGHDGRFAYIYNMLDHYRSGVVNGPTTDPLVKDKIQLSNFEIGQLEAFLRTLSDTAFIKDKRYSAPQ